MQAQAVEVEDAVIGKDGELLRGQRPPRWYLSHVVLASTVAPPLYLYTSTSTLCSLFSFYKEYVAGLAIVQDSGSLDILVYPVLCWNWISLPVASPAASM